MPHLNSRPFTAERLATIVDQTFGHWELVIIDSSSTDGSLDILERLARTDRRVSVHQGPRDGIYTNLNRGLGRCTGKYVYVATSDDTMANDCLEKLVTALETRPDCELAHCRLHMIDEQGRAIPDWWPRLSTFALSSGKLLDQAHVRRAPLDGLLHLLGGNVYISLTQLLIRRTLFERVGLFESRWGPSGDFNWEMRAGLVANTVHVPETWAGWRVHPNQATVAAGLESAEHARKIEEMIQDALGTCEQDLTAAIKGPLLSRWRERVRDVRRFSLGLKQCRGLLQAGTFIARRLFSGSWAARRHVVSRLARQHSLSRSMPELIRSWLENTSSGPVLIPINFGDQNEQSTRPISRASAPEMPIACD